MAFRAAGHIQRTSRSGHWPGGCAPLVVGKARLLPRGETMRWLRRVSTPRDVDRAMLRGLR